MRRHENCQGPNARKESHLEANRRAELEHDMSCLANKEQHVCIERELGCVLIHVHICNNKKSARSFARL